MSAGEVTGAAAWVGAVLSNRHVVEPQEALRARAVTLVMLLAAAGSVVGGLNVWLQGPPVRGALLPLCAASLALNLVFYAVARTRWFRRAALGWALVLPILVTATVVRQPSAPVFLVGFAHLVLGVGLVSVLSPPGRALLLLLLYLPLPLAVARRCGVADAHAGAITTFLVVACGLMMLLAVLARRSEQLDAELGRSHDEALTRATQRLRRRTDALERANAELRAFGRAAAHDLSEPIRTIHNFTDILVDELGGDLDEDGRRSVERIVGAAARLEERVQAMGRHADLSRDRVMLRVVDSRALVDAACDAAGLRPPVEVRVGGVWPDLWTEPDLLRAALAALLDNAARFTREAAPVVEVTGTLQPDGGLDIEVRDDGIGIDPRFHAQIFEPFRRLHPPDQFPGAGMGLAVARKAMHQLQGSIGVASTLGVGSTFTLHHPERDPDGPEESMVLYLE